MTKKLGGKLYGPRLYGLRPFDGWLFFKKKDPKMYLMGFEFGQIQRALLHGLGLALMMGRLVVLCPFCGLSLRKTDLTGSFVGLSLDGPSIFCGL